MQGAVFFDTVHGNTHQLAEKIGEILRFQIFNIRQVSPIDFQKFRRIVFGTPTHGGGYTMNVRELLAKIPSLENVELAVFDTCAKPTLFGRAAPRLARTLEEKGGRIIAQPQSLFAKGIKWPLMQGELERAMDWARELGQITN